MRAVCIFFTRTSTCSHADLQLNDAVNRDNFYGKKLHMTNYRKNRGKISIFVCDTLLSCWQCPSSRRERGWFSLKYIRSREFAVMLCLGLFFLSTDVDGRILKKRIIQGIFGVIRSSGSRQGDESSSAGKNLVLFGSKRRN